MRMGYKNRSIIFVGIIFICLTLVGCGKPKGQQGGIPEVVVAVMQPERLPITTELPGRTSAFLIAEVRPQVSGVIQKRLFNEGDTVQTGQPLYQIDPASYEAADAGAKAALAPGLQRRHRPQQRHAIAPARNGHKHRHVGPGRWRPSFSQFGFEWMEHGRGQWVGYASA